MRTPRGAVDSKANNPMHLSEALKRTLRATVQWQPISLRSSQGISEVRLVAGPCEFDVSANSVIAALSPLTIAIGLDTQMRAALVSASEPELHFFDPTRERPLGVLRLHRMTLWNTTETPLALFEVRRGSHACAPWPRRAWDNYLYGRAAAKSPHPQNFWLPRSVVEQTLIFFMRPRPIVLVGVDDGQHSNIFPMDLVGPVASHGFTLALRNSRQSVEAVKRARRVALSRIAADDHRIAFQLGANHKVVTMDRDTLPFKLSRSKVLSQPIPATALRVLEVDIHDCRSIGSHTLFVGRVVSDEQMRNGPELFLTCGVHQRLRMHHGCPFATPGS
jgi:flavin reductase (DIM6/NTAB) family NADH-FMN oxidoreductase RutF